MTTIREPARELPLSGSCDVAVVGGGIAGVAAALAAARNGARTVLIERLFGLGGLATLGNVVIYEPLCDGRGRQVIGGLGEELLLRSVADLRRKQLQIQFRPAPECWKAGGDPAERAKDRYEAAFNPFSFQMEMEAMLAEAGVDLWYDTRLCACVREQPQAARGSAGGAFRGRAAPGADATPGTEGARAGEAGSPAAGGRGRCGAGRITHLIVENKDGRSALACRTVVDASGDADVCAFAGEPTAELDTNVLCGWHYMMEDGALKIHALSKNFSEDGGSDGSEGPLLSGVKARDVTRHVVETRRWIRERLISARQRRPQAEIHPFALASIPCFRMTRRLAAPFALLGEHMHTWFDDAIGLTGDWRRSGPVWALPYRCIRAEANRNLLTAGRCISSAGRAWDMSRVISTCAVTGEAAGTAAALAARDHAGDAHALPVPDLQAQLRRQKVILDPELVRPAT